MYDDKRKIITIQNIGTQRFHSKDLNGKKGKSPRYLIYPSVIVS